MRGYRALLTIYEPVTALGAHAAPAVLGSKVVAMPLQSWYHGLHARHGGRHAARPPAVDDGRQAAGGRAARYSSVSSKPAASSPSATSDRAGGERRAGAAASFSHFRRTPAPPHPPERPPRWARRRRGLARRAGAPRARRARLRPYALLHRPDDRRRLYPQHLLAIEEREPSASICNRTTARQPLGEVWSAADPDGLLGGRATRAS